MSEIKIDCVVCHKCNNTFSAAEYNEHDCGKTDREICEAATLLVNALESRIEEYESLQDHELTEGTQGTREGENGDSSSAQCGLDQGE